MTENRRVKLGESVGSSVSWLYMSDTGDLIVEFYDFSSAAENAFGNDVAFMLTIAARQKKRMLDSLGAAAGDPKDANPDDALLDLMQRRFGSYFEVKKWLDAERVPYEKKFDPHA